MAIILDQEKHDALTRTIAERLLAARKLAGMNEKEVSAALGLKNGTQCTLHEKGERRPTIGQMIEYAQLYGVSVSYLVGEFNSPLHMPVTLHRNTVERNLVEIYGPIVGQVAETMAKALDTPVAEYQIADIKTAKRILERSEELRAAYKRMKELNPDFEEETRGSARVEAAIDAMLRLADELTASMEDHRKRTEDAKELLRGIWESGEFPDDEESAE